MLIYTPLVVVCMATYHVSATTIPQVPKACLMMAVWTNKRIRRAMAWYGSDVWALFWPLLHSPSPSFSFGTIHKGCLH